MNNPKENPMRTRSFREVQHSDMGGAGQAVRTNSVHLPAKVASPASDKQLAFIRTLVDERELPDEARAQFEARLQSGDISKDRASDFITRLLEQPRRTTQVQTPEPAEAKVPNGRYAIESSEIEPGDSGIRFYKINTPTEGRWAGFTFVDAGAGGPHGDPNWHPIRNRAHRSQILNAIAKDPKAAMLRYGTELGHCGHCGRTLTDETSRELGIGPVCRDKMDW